MVNTLQMRKEAAERYREAEAVSATMVYPGISVEEVQRPRMTAASLAAKVQYVSVLYLRTPPMCQVTLRVKVSGSCFQDGPAPIP